MSKTIIYIGGFELPDKNAAAQRVLANAKILRDSGFEVVFIGITHDSFVNKIEYIEHCYKGFDSYSLKYPNSYFQWMKYIFRFGVIAEIISKYANVDTIIAYNYPALSLLKLKNYAHHNGYKIIADCTEWYSIKNVCSKVKVLKAVDTFLRMRIIQKQLDGIIVISHYLRDYYHDIKNVVLIPPLVDVADPMWSINGEDIGTEAVNFIYAGNPGKTKDNICSIVDCVCNLPKEYKCKLFILGLKEEQFYQLYPKFKRMPICSRVIFLGRCSHDKCLAYIKIADCSLIIRDGNRSNNAGFPTKFVEAMTLNTDVLATNISDLNYYKKNGHLYIVDSNLENSLMEYIDGFRRNNNCSEICSVFDYHNYADSFLDFMKQIHE
jgi:hypothetical protein